jgi:hypothetical protein
MSLGKFSNKPRVVPLFSIESGVTTGALVEIAPGIPPHITYCVAESFAIQKKLDSDRLEDSAVKTIDNVAKKVVDYFSKNRKGSLAAPVIVLGSPWYFSHTSVIKSTTKQPQLIKEDFIAALIKDEIQKVKESRSLAGKASIMDTKIINSLLNGYSTDNPAGKKASQIELSVFFTLIPQSFKEKIENALHTSISKTVSSWHTSPIVFSTSLASLFFQESDFIIADVGAELTELSFIKDKHLIETATFPYGSSTVIRHISSKIKVTLQLASSLLALTEEEKITKTMSEKLEKALEDFEAEWKIIFTDSLTQLSAGKMLPKKICLVVQPEFTQLFKRLIENEEFAQSAQPDGKFEIITKDAFDLAKHISIDSNIAAPLILVFESLFIDWLLSGEQNSVK